MMPTQSLRGSGAGYKEGKGCAEKPRSKHLEPGRPPRWRGHLTFGVPRVRRAGSRSINVLALALTLTGSTAFGDDQLDIRVYNDTADEIFVTVYDMNAGSPRPVLARQVIDGFAWLTTSVTPSIGSDGHVRWIAQTIGTAFHRCGYGESGGLRTNTMVKVFTDSRCVKISPRP
jgi:hypothetical protein